MTLAQMRAAMIAKREAAEARATAAGTEFDAITARATAEKRELTAEEDTRTDELLAALKASRATIKGLAADIERIDGEIADEKRAADAAKVTESTGAPEVKRTGGAVVGREERTYDAEKTKRGEVSFLADVASGMVGGDFEARGRLERHMTEERVERGQQIRAVGTGAFSGLVIPQYLVDMFLPAATAGRPFADICNHHDLPSTGMQVNLARVTTTTSVAIQASEGASVSETDMDDTNLAVSIQTNAGQQTASLQSLQRGQGTEGIILQDLGKQYAKNLDNTLLNQATNGLTNVATATAYTDASPTAAELYPKFHSAMSGMEAIFLDMAYVDFAVMHSRRWYWLQKELTSTWPAFAQPNLDVQALGKNLGVGYNKGIRGYLPNGIPVVVDNNIATNLGAGTNEDEIYLVASEECHLWEDPSAPVYIRAEQTKAATLQVLFVVYGYFAYTFNRFSGGQAKIGGTGLVTPTF